MVPVARVLRERRLRRAPGPRHVLRVVDDLERRNAVRFLISKALQMFANQMFANFWRARSRLYRKQCLQESMHFAAFFKLYKMCTLLHRSKRNILPRSRFKKSAIFVKTPSTFLILQILQNLQFFAKFLRIQLDNLVDLKKC